VITSDLPDPRTTPLGRGGARPGVWRLP